MSFEYIKEHYEVPAEIGRVVTVDGARGIIIKDMGNYIGVNFDSDKAGILRLAIQHGKLFMAELKSQEK